MLLFLTFSIFTVSSQLYNTSLFTLGNNIFLNPNFSIPDQGYEHSMGYANSVLGWNCSMTCQLVNIVTLFPFHGVTVPPYVQQAIDLNSYVNFQQVSQQVTLAQTAQYLLSVYWLDPVLSPIGKSFQIRFNGAVLDTLIVSTVNRVVHENQYLLNLTTGINTVSFQMLGVPSDGAGIYIVNVSLQQLLPYVPPTIPVTINITNQPENQFYIVLNNQTKQNSVYSKLNHISNITTDYASQITRFVSSIPLSIYFLGFINYFSLSSLYILLNVRIPSNLYDYLEIVYGELNKDILMMFGTEISIRSYSYDRVDSKRGQFFGVNSDLPQSNSILFLFVAANILFIVFVNWLSSFLNRNNPLRKIMSQEKKNMIFGHIINVIIPLTLPWTFMMLQNGVRDFGTKLNAACYLVLYFTGIFFPIYYFFELLQEREKKLIERRKTAEAFSKRFNIIEQNQQRPSQKKDNKTEGSPKKRILGKPGRNHFYRNSKYTQKPPIMLPKNTKELNVSLDKKDKRIEIIFEKQKDQQSSQLKANMKNPRKADIIELDKYRKIALDPITFRDLITFEILEHWYLCQANFIFPCLVLIANPIFFLVIIQLYTFLGVLIAFNKKQRRFNSTLLALEPFIYHVCFIIFYFSGSVNMLISTQLISLGVFIFGIIHHLFTLVYDAIYFSIRLIRQCCKGSGVTPQNRNLNVDKQQIKESGDNQKYIQRHKQKKVCKILKKHKREIVGVDNREQLKRTKIKKKKEIVNGNYIITIDYDKQL